MSIRGMVSLVMIAIAIAIIYFNDDVLGGILGSLVLIAMLVMWVLPPELFQRRTKTDRPTDPAISRASGTLFGIGMGLILAAVVAILAPGIMDWLLIGVGVAMLAWFFIFQRR